MPTFIASAISYIYGAYEAAEAAGGIYAVIADVIVAVAVNLAATKITQALAGKPSQNQNATPASRTITARGTTEFQQLIYGQIRTAGYLAYFGTSGIESRFLLRYLDR